ncbi:MULTISPECIES: RNA-dependent RNA polymerase [unclassified Clostridium]|uniref:RNA-dependent RNA polymerase n=1 Tax=unclassified Clostridium TaxID=2614128 RepID=UPI0013F8FB16|nr:MULTISPECIES: RNA-dependent RNA polymerase [unclassified Clostridium]MBN1038810.1 RNA-dependent RNA polymerase [Clostridium botulinum]NFI58022.1 RNA-dependent RNA polymerase [Clostridium botulinum]
MNNNKKIYSYIENKMIDPNDKSIKFNPKKHSSFTVGDLLKRIVAILCMIFVVYNIFAYKNKHTPINVTKDFINDTSNLISTSNTILNKIVFEYNNNNFSNSYKQELNNSLSDLDKFSIDTYSDSKFNLLKSNISNISNETKDCIHLILNSNCADTYTSNSINSNLSSIRNNINLNRELLTKFFDENNIIYTIDENNQIHYQLPN